MTVDRLTLAYDGRGYAGWQRQENALAVQQVVEEALRDLLGARVVVHGAGRTDAGVHALGQVAHLTVDEALEQAADESAVRRLPPKALALATNHRLPPDIRVCAAARMGAGFHARKSTLGKRYVYRLWRGRVVPPTLAATHISVPATLDLAAVRRAARRLEGRHDFSAFALAGGAHVSPVRRLMALEVTDDPRGGAVTLGFVGDGFLRGMVRALVGTLLEVGRGRRAADSVVDLLRPGTDRADAGPTAPAHGLCLERVLYPPRWRPLESWRG